MLQCGFQKNLDLIEQGNVLGNRQQKKPRKFCLAKKYLWNLTQAIKDTPGGVGKEEKSCFFMLKLFCEKGFGKRNNLKRQEGKIFFEKVGKG